MIIVSDSRSYGDDVDLSSFKVDRITEKSAICSQEKNPVLRQTFSLNESELFIF